jgi:putative heme-binding domain-containing protein
LKTVLRVDGLKRRLKDFGPAVQERTQSLYSAIDAESGKQLARLETLLSDLPKGDIRRGQEVFNRPKNNCVACHAIGYVGGKTGPDLTRIGATRVPRDLLEAIVFPSASFVRGYEPVQILTRDGKAHNGLIQSESPDELALSTGPSDVVRIIRRDIDEIQPSRVSVMPAGLEQQLSMQELADLVAFLQACK